MNDKRISDLKINEMQVFMDETDSKYAEICKNCHQISTKYETLKDNNKVLQSSVAALLDEKRRKPYAVLDQVIVMIYFVN